MKKDERALERCRKHEIVKGSKSNRVSWGLLRAKSGCGGASCLGINVSLELRKRGPVCDHSQSVNKKIQWYLVHFVRHNWCCLFKIDSSFGLKCKGRRYWMSHSEYFVKRFEYEHVC